MSGDKHHRTEDLDPISLEIVWNRLLSIIDETAVALVRSAFSNIVRESKDFACAILDSDGESIAENSVGVPSFVGVLPRTMKHFLAALPRESWRPGDVAITNDPWMATGHLVDVTMASPIFHEGRLVAFYISVAHVADMGGVGYAADGRSVYEEGLRIPPMWFQREGKLEEGLLTLLRANIRVPDEVIEDFRARVTTSFVCARKLDEFLSEQKLDLSALSRLVQDRSETAMRTAIEKVADGTYRHEVVTDGYESPIHLRVAITVEGSDVLVDYTGSSPQQDRGINSVMNYTWAYTAYPIKCALDPFTPKNGGSYRPIAVVAPEGSVLNPRFPAPVTARQQVGHWLPQVVLGALAQAVPDRVMAECGSSPTFTIVFTGQDAHARPFSTTVFAFGGMGGRMGLDGLHCTAYPTSATFGSLEAMEVVSPMQIRWRHLLPDSGGAGRYRGGCGQHIALSVNSPYPSMVSVMADRVRHPASGLGGGLPGSPTRLYLNERQPVHPKSRFKMAPGDVLHILCPGGGGYGDPRSRERTRVLTDLEQGIVTRESAGQHYEVVPLEGEIGEEPEGGDASVHPTAP